MANGGGYSRGGLDQAGDVTGFEPQATESIRILDETLTVLLGPKFADVEVRYLMRNETTKRVTVRFGFPVEESFGIDWGGIPNRHHEEPMYCRNYSVAAGGRPLLVRWQAEAPGNRDARFKGLAGWLVSEMKFAAGEEKPVVIRFQSYYPEFTKTVSDDSYTSASIFKYRLSTAACWAGTIGRGRIVLRPAGIDPAELRVLKPVNRFKKEGEDWVWNFEDLEPTLADDLEIEAVPETFGYDIPDANTSGYYLRRGERWSMVHSNYAVTASSTLPPEGNTRYDAGNLKGRRAWSEGAPGPGIGEWLELKPEAPKRLAAISLAPGFRDDRESFENNARPKRILVELNGEHRFRAEIPDAPDEFRIPVNGYAKPVQTLRLTFEDVWPGTRYEDLCLRELRLHVHLDKEPKIQPAR
jgi:hypothetical protein